LSKLITKCLTDFTIIFECNEIEKESSTHLMLVLLGVNYLTKNKTKRQKIISIEDQTYLVKTLFPF